MHDLDFGSAGHAAGQANKKSTGRGRAQKSE
jgi:hypothetical protein